MLVFPDNVKFVTTTTGTGTLAVGAAVAGCRGMDAVTDGDQVIYRITSGTDWEIGIGTWDSSAETLTRSVRRSSNSNSAINLPAGDKEVFAGVSEDELDLLANYINDTTNNNFSVGPGNLPDITTGEDNVVFGIDNGVGLTEGIANVLIGLDLVTASPTSIGEVQLGIGNQPLIKGFQGGGFGNLSPGRASFYDIGLTGQRWRHGWFSGNVTASGTVVAGSNISASSGTITGQTIAATETLTVRSKEVGPLMPGYTGLKISRTSSTVISIAKGAIHNNLLTRRIDVDTAITLDLAEGGDFVNSSSRATNTWYHVLIGLIGNTVVAGLSTTLAKPAAWDSWQMIGAAKTDATGSGEWELFENDKESFRSSGNVFVFNNTAPGTSVNTIRAWCPPIACQVQVIYRANNPSGGTTIRVTNVSGTIIGLGMTVTSGQPNSYFTTTVNADTNGEFGLELSNNVTFGTLVIAGEGFRYPVGEAARYD